MNIETCPIMAECKFFQNSSYSSVIVTETYKKKFCLSSPSFMSCKRFVVYLETGRQAPDYIMPNSPLTIDEIARKIEL